MGKRSARGAAWLAIGLLAAPGLLRADSASDRQIEEAARTSYNFRAVLADEVTVKANQGVVTLSGTVRDRHQKALAEDTVRSLPGVVDVRNHLDITAPGRERSDGWLELKIRGIFLLLPEVSARKIQVDVRDGVVLLSGVADSVEQREAAEARARSIEGVRSVRNEIRLAPRALAKAAAENRPSPEDRAITARVRDALQAHEGTRSLQTEIVTDDGEVLIRGTASSPAERELVTRIARGVEGVESVKNQMVSAAE